MISHFTSALLQVAVSDDKAVVYEALGALSNLARSNVARRAVCAEKGVQVVLAVLQVVCACVCARASVFCVRVCVYVLYDPVPPPHPHPQRDIEDAKMAPRALDVLLRVCADADGTKAVVAAGGACCRCCQCHTTPRPQALPVSSTLSSTASNRQPRSLPSAC
jgi:hypothetical protein